MSAITFDNRAAFSYQLRLPTFEGPLDLLLKLIERQDLPITDVSLVMVSDQFLDAARAVGGAHPESVAEFASVGARLVLLKAKSLLPRPAADDEDDEPSDLVVQLIEYRAVKQAAAEFGNWDRIGNAAFVKGSQAVELPQKPKDLPLAYHEPNLLVRAISRRLVSKSSVSHMVAVRPLVSMSVIVGRLLEALGPEKVTFQELAVRVSGSSQDRRALFLALLVLVRRSAVEVEQAEPFSDIWVSRLAPAGMTAPGEIEEFSADG
jgi:segregation and condensation protein A